jgi:hypothetical protein
MTQLASKHSLSKSNRIRSQKKSDKLYLFCRIFGLFRVSGCPIKQRGLETQASVFFDLKRQVCYCGSVFA